MLAVRVALDISDSVGCPISVRDLYSSSTPRNLAAHIEQNMRTRTTLAQQTEETKIAPARTLIKIKRVDSRPTIYMVHDVFGLSTPYRALAPHLNLNLVGFNDPYFGLEYGGFTSVNAMASYYLDQISPLPRDGITLLGWSFGGTVAFEMAQRCDELGIPVHLILVDAPRVNKDTKMRHDVDEFVRRQNHPESLMECLLAEVRKNVDILKAYSPRRRLSDRSRITSLKAMKHPDFTDRDLTPEDGVLFDERNGWDDEVGSRWTTVKINGSHFELFKEPVVEEIARAIKVAEGLDE